MSACDNSRITLDNSESTGLWVWNVINSRNMAAIVLQMSTKRESSLKQLEVAEEVSIDDETIDQQVHTALLNTINRVFGGPHFSTESLSSYALFQ